MGRRFKIEIRNAANHDDLRTKLLAIAWIDTHVCQSGEICDAEIDSMGWQGIWSKLESDGLLGQKIESVTGFTRWCLTELGTAHCRERAIDVFAGLLLTEID